MTNLWERHMVWNGKSTMELRSEFVRLASQPGANKSQLCRQFEITRKTAYKWLSRASDGDEVFKDYSRRPKSHPDKTPLEIEELIVKIRKKHPDWGGRKLNAWLLRKNYKDIPAPSTITKILRRNNLLNETISKQNKAWIRFEHERPNKLWQMDFKGHFAMAKSRCHPLTILDDHSRFSVALEACANERRTTVEAKLLLVFKRYGLPERINVDNGSPWGCSQKEYITQMAIWLIRLGINVSYSRPHHPQTNGKIERFHRSLNTEILNYRVFYDLNAAQKAFQAWRKIYNEERPHEALDMQVPIDRYHSSHREFPKKLPDIEYDLNDIVKKVHNKGAIRFKGKDIFISEGLGNLNVGLKSTTKDMEYDVYFCHQKIKRINLMDYE